ncbi:protein of unknown function DUF305 [Gordonia bronchialis DSM 43247]|uniref:DUF305 domain-containing protein n=1 Tax=Gordonia bronchialis (strain ATCC 25592 / DSM 43247 / BCRC 13721 / JCM 3198 / KCTC 3076 / NBRC 16047 / NCTC 10667) TaxID=526226 RepID=D0L9G4_GORB4|nr:DUF305 domain-containing protein [Gordonia bronchialis]ACY21152.1 protein of unknown function DUF305 [Gordonia bronchialis DSM 43247]MCC3323935.1 DUF305 domain-containing protein [Gordonia bronchialis]QGS25153.1 DUF305 domain-containing protein [Gordonia bronchialis]UAK38570.1 DUF305 domain-containing protein [Gordonia bronchialis]STQ64021.1 Uncharacterized protein conserved in bacteria [Gordonia bronchialis]
MAENADEGDSTTVESADSPAAPRSHSRLLLALAGIAILLVGVGLGLVIQASFADDTSADEDQPAANSAAVGFAQDMTRHHEQGVAMAQEVLKHGSGDVQVTSLATDIMLTQTNEIGQMQSWLSRWHQPFINPGAPMAWMGHDMAGMSTDQDHADDHSGHSDMSGMPMDTPSSPAPGPNAEQPPMPGMATDSEMARLRSLSGPAADTYFLQLMLRHHEGGVHMMQYAADPANVSQDYVRDLATAMLNTQANEIETLKTMLASRNAQPLPMN